MDELDEVTETKHEADGWYARAPGTKWLGPWATAWEAQKYFRLVFCVE